MPFRFALGPLLRLRQSMERQQALRLSEASLAVARAQQTLTELDQFLATSAEADCAVLGAGRRAAEIQFAAAAQENLRALRLRLEFDLKRLDRERQKAAEIYHRAYREREILETLRTRQHRVYQQEALRREQRDLDEAHLLQMWRRRADWIIAELFTATNAEFALVDRFHPRSSRFRRLQLIESAINNAFAQYVHPDGAVGEPNANNLSVQSCRPHSSRLRR